MDVQPAPVGQLAVLVDPWLDGHLDAAVEVERDAGDGALEARHAIVAVAPEEVNIVGQGIGTLQDSCPASPITARTSSSRRIRCRPRRRDLDLGAAVLGEQHAVAGLDVERDPLRRPCRGASPIAITSLDGLLLGGVGDEEAAGSLFLGFDALDEDAVVEGADGRRRGRGRGSHGDSPSAWGYGDHQAVEIFEGGQRHVRVSSSRVAQAARASLHVNPPTRNFWRDLRAASRKSSTNSAVTGGAPQVLAADRAGGELLGARRVPGLTADEELVPVLSTHVRRHPLDVLVSQVGVAVGEHLTAVRWRRRRTHDRQCRLRDLHGLHRTLSCGGLRACGSRRTLRPSTRFRLRRVRLRDVDRLLGA